MNEKFFLSIVIPVYNEEKRILPTLQSVTRFVETKDFPSQVVIVDDGSMDGSVSLVKKFFGCNPTLRLIEGKPNHGKGWAVREGCLSAEGKFILFMDADLSVPIVMVDAFVEKIQEGFDIVIGTRRAKDSKVLVHQPFYREWLGVGFTWLSNIILGTSYSDFTCGFKLFRRTTTRDLFEKQKLKDWSFDPEILYLARKFNKKCVEHPVVWRNDPQTTVRLSRDIWQSFWSLLKISFQHRHLESSFPDKIGESGQ